jgi:hypothetical protein
MAHLHVHPAASLKASHSHGVASSGKIDGTAPLLRLVQAVIVDKKTVGNTGSACCRAVGRNVEHAAIIGRDAEVVVAGFLNCKLRKEMSLVQCLTTQQGSGL